MHRFDTKELVVKEKVEIWLSMNFGLVSSDLWNITSFIEKQD